MSQTQTPLSQAPDLRKSYPRSPGETLGCYVLLPRILDKCRATVNGTNGEYKYGCPLDMQFFNFVKIVPETFRAEVAQGKTDAELLRWVGVNGHPKSEEEILQWSYQQRTRRPDPDRQAHFEKMRMENCPGNPYVETWFQLLDAEEERFLTR